MPKQSEKPVAIEPYTQKEEHERGTPKSEINMAEDPEYPKEWKSKAKLIADLIDKGFKYHKRKVRGIEYMLLRKGKKDRSLGAWSAEKEGKLFLFYPHLQTTGGTTRPPPWSRGVTGQGRSFLSIPINRLAVIPRDYVPSITVIRYFQFLCDNGFDKDFSTFINEIIVEHFQHCHGIYLPVVLEGEVELLQENQGGKENGETIIPK